MASKVKIAKNVTVSPANAARMRKKAGGSNVGRYKGVKASEMAGTAGGSPRGTFPINTLARARNAIQRSHNAPNPAGIKEKVYKKWPNLRPSSNKKK